MKNNILKVGIIDLKFNNLFSIYKACMQAGFKTSIILPKQNNFNFDCVIIPGVGAFKSGMQVLKKNNYDEKIFDYVSKKNSFIYGICLGMQLLFENSYEFGLTKGLGLIKGSILKLSDKNKKLKTNIGWKAITLLNKNKNSNLEKFDKKYFYFVHSYYASPKNKVESIAKTNHGKFLFTSVVNKGNILGTQFHPEKSGNLGIKFLKNIKYYKG